MTEAAKPPSHANAEPAKITFGRIGDTHAGTILLLVEKDLALSPVARELDRRTGGQLTRAAKSTGFSGLKKTNLDLVAPAESGIDRIILIGVGDANAMKLTDWLDLGGTICGMMQAKKIADAILYLEAASAKDAAEVGLGAILRSYNFKKYKTKPNSDGANGSNGKAHSLTIGVSSDPRAAGDAFAGRKAIAEGVFIARDLVNEPANILGPVEFAAKAAELSKIGVEVEILDVEKMTALGMGSLVAVGVGSERPSRMAIMQWNGSGKKRQKPLAIVGKGVVFDTGGISMKPAKGMEDMKGDMGGAACVTGLMHALATRKAKTNVVGIIGLVENMPDGKAQRPGDIVTSMSGQTIEVLNTDAEGRLVLADALWYCQQRFKPKAMIDLATLTGAIMVALGKEFAGLFSNNDQLAGWLLEAGEATQERVWRMPLDPAYDRDIDSKNADVKNIGGAYGGACTAAQFIQRFVNEVPWAHLDIAGTAMGSNKSEINESWGSGWGVRLLDRLIAEHYED